ncbi:ATP-binding cassette domain-containing protein [Bilophila wadsworthia]|uniref:ATP-binding cassette domain-containing protein n=1 Tax=Bilophila wadsworthia TaxID=35833 RepID=UPI001E11F26A|nr:ATP-binding cassette domain-containing protein [Bilophila wadsworthia]MCG4632392.1 ATP-binding cassette domain-containing protein [Bilophila wadsworthia]HJH15141.1 ATP-binding cassette domain-containing protein [Bilophila wadsworthia]
MSIQKQLEAFALQVSFVLASHGITVLWGASGSGKTTLLQCLAGLLRPDAGRIACREAVWFDAERGVCLAPERRRLGYVFQDVRLFPHLSVRSNMLFGRRFRGPSGVSFEDVVALLGLGRLLHRTPSDLSGGEKQRVAVGRALLACPELLLMDEPLTGLDRGKREEIMAYVKAIPERFGVPILYVTHSDAERRFLADRVLNLEDGKLTEY